MHKPVHTYFTNIDIDYIHGLYHEKKVFVQESLQEVQ